jgi:multicomponent Na+:H+ antiporter subunit B
MSEPAPERELHGREPTHRPWLGALAAGGVLVGLVVAFADLPDETAALPAIARRAMVQTLPKFRTTEPVSAVVYGFRAMDTFGETFLLLAAVVSVVVLTRTREPRRGFVGEERAGEEEQRRVDRGGSDEGSMTAREAEAEEEGLGDAPATPDDEPLATPAPERAEAMTVVTRTAVRVVLPLLAVAGCYLVSQGYSPGGGFPAGAVALGLVLLVHTAFGYRRIAPVVRPVVMEAVETVGALAIIVALLLGIPFAGSLAASWVPLAPEQTLRSGGILQVFSVSELVEVGSGLVIVVFALIGMRHDWAPDPESDSSEDDR